MSVQDEKVRDLADRILDIAIETGRWLLAIGFIGVAGLILARTLAAAP